MAGKSKILFIGEFLLPPLGTGYIGKFIVEASAKAGHDTFVLGDLCDHVSLVKAIKQVDVVISTVGHSLLAHQLNIIATINEAGNVKRFFPSEFGNDVDRLHTVEPTKTTFNTEVQIRRAVEAEGIPFTYVVNFYCADFFLPNLAQPGHVVGPSAGPPKDKVIILGDGNAKGQDFVTYTIKAVDDPKTLNKILYIKPPQNIITLNELKKTGKNLERIYVPGEQVLNNIQEAMFPLNMALSISYPAFVKGEQTNFEIDPSFGVEASQVYPHVKHTPVDEILNQYV
ncbi:hypothetical protein H5410_052311 [Solanum commersonii]|uniref:NmrA-like domain-containing protein n=1 Tax=Solanum commersonii TaxID=4109 RepID=A0A9J5X311_SOLCO|nr:hypothetical protein H5410_052311 [Solanum commersonii]